MLTHIQTYKNELIKFLYEINENVDWNDFINQYASLPPEKILTRIKSLVWINKNLDYDNGLQENIKLYSYYTKLLNKYYKLLSKQYIVVYILVTPDAPLRNESIDNFIINEVNQKLNILCNLLTFMNINYKLVTSLPSDAKIVIPTCSITYRDPNSLFTSFNGLLIADNYHNIYTHESDIEMNKFKLSVIQLSKNNEITINEILTQQYGFLKLIT